MPHHLTQRENRREETFFCDDDYQAYLDLMAEQCGKHERTGRPLGDDDFQKRLEKKRGRVLRPPRPGPKKPGIIRYTAPGTRSGIPELPGLHFTGLSVNSLMVNPLTGSLREKRRTFRPLTRVTSTG